MDIIPQDTPMKQCPKCTHDFPATTQYFPPRKDGKNGLKNICRVCLKHQVDSFREAHKEEKDARTKAFYQAHREEICARQREYGQDHKEQAKTYAKGYRQTHKEELAQQMKEYRQAHNEELAAYQKEYRQVHKEESDAWHKEYRQAHKEQVVARTKRHYQSHREEYYTHNRNRRTRVRNNGGTHTAEDIRKQYERQKGRCYYGACGHAKLGKNRSSYHVDHVIPVTRGGSSDPSNLVIACPSCNLSKLNRLPHEWPEGGRLL